MRRIPFSLLGLAIPNNDVDRRNYLHVGSNIAETRIDHLFTDSCTAVHAWMRKLLDTSHASLRPWHLLFLLTLAKQTKVIAVCCCCCCSSSSRVCRRQSSRIMPISHIPFPARRSSTTISEHEHEVWIRLASPLLHAQELVIQSICQLACTRYSISCRRWSFRCSLLCIAKWFEGPW